MTLIASRTSISPVLIALSNPFIAFCDSLINTINSGIMTGKLNTAIIVLLLPVLALMPDTMVKTEAKLILPSNTAIR